MKRPLIFGIGRWAGQTLLRIGFSYMSEFDESDSWSRSLTFDGQRSRSTFTSIKSNGEPGMRVSDTFSRSWSRSFPWSDSWSRHKSLSVDVEKWKNHEQGIVGSI